VGNRSSAYEEVISLFAGLSKIIPDFVDGKSAILEMKNGGSTNWKQMEWIGFWFEFFLETNLIPVLGGSSGPTYGTTRFDFKKKFVWDLKAHPIGSKTLILNDQKAVRECASKEGGIGFIIISGETTYDDEKSSFKVWHDSLKGGTSTYEKERVKRGAPSRRRKVSFKPSQLHSIWFDNLNEINIAVEAGWLKSFQTGMRNSNGEPRPAKFMINMNNIPKMSVISELEISRK
jgi:hypothetical protein